jgi:Ca-activated chloride channel homolog
MSYQTSKFYIALIYTALLGLILAGCGGGDSSVAVNDEPTSATPRNRDAQTIVLVSSDTWWDGIYLPTYVTKAILEDEMGYTVQIVNGASVPEFFELVDSGRADVFMSGWFPTNDFTFEQYPNLVRVGQVYGGRERDAFEGWMATNDFARQYDIERIEDLFKPDVVAALDTDNDGKGELIGCPQAWACSQRHTEIMKDYGLDSLYDMEPISDEETMLSLIDSRTQANDPAVFYMYQPVAYPQEGTLADRATWIEGTEPYLPLAFNRGVTRSEFVASHPDVVHLMSNVRIPGSDIGAVMRRVSNDGRSPAMLDDIATQWIADNRDRVNDWLPTTEFTPDVATTYPPALPEDTLTIAYSPDKENLFLELVTTYNLNRDPETPPIHPLRVEVDEMLDGATDGWYGAISPDSSLWISQLDRAWQDENPGAASLVSNIERYALSPVVIAMLESRAEAVGYPETAIGWRDLMTIAQEDSSFRWSHPSISSATGLLSLTAEFYSATGKLENLTRADIEDDESIAYVEEIEATVDRYGAETEDRVIVRNLAAGGQQLDAFVTQEQKVIFFNRNSPSTELVAIYPEEGTFWMDHPLALLDGDWVSDAQRRVFRDFANFVAEPAQQDTVLEWGYRPAELATGIDSAESPIRPEFNVDPNEPTTLLQVPSPGTLEAIREAWLLTKRPADIVLVIDVSGSMEGDKLSGVKGALFSFIDQIQGDRDRVALVTFSDSSRLVQPLAPMDEAAFSSSVRQLEAGGGTQLYDAVTFALDHLEQESDGERAQVIVAMTDGQSNGRIDVLENAIDDNEGRAIIYAVGYGEDADLTILQRIAQLGEGRVYPSDPETISQLYALLSEFF